MLEILCDAGSGRTLPGAWPGSARFGVQGDRAVFRPRLTRGYAPAAEENRRRMPRSALLAVDGIVEVQVELAQPEQSRCRHKPRTGRVGPTARAQGIPASSGDRREQRQGRGGGKSTVAVNLACALAGRA